MRPIVLSIVIVGYNAKRFLGACLSSIQKTTRDLAIEIILVDNNSSDGSVDFVKTHFPRVRIIKNKMNVGFAKANNQGIMQAKGSHILLLNPDTIVVDQAINKLLGFAKSNQYFGVIGCRVVNLRNELQLDSCGRFLTLQTLCWKVSAAEKLWPKSRIFGARLLTSWPRNTSRQIDWVSGVCMLIKRRVIDEVGGLDEQFFAYYEDMDFCRQAANMKWPTYFLHNAEIVHVLSSSWRDRTEEQLLISLRSEGKYLRKYHKGLGVMLFRVLYFYGSGIRLVAHIMSRNKTKARKHYKILKWIMKNEL